MNTIEQAVEEQQAAVDLADTMQHGQSLLKRVDLALQVEHFLASALGRQLVEDTARERMDLLTQLVALDADDAGDRKRIREIKLQIGILDHWKEVFANYLNDGEVAEKEFHERGDA